jgi:replicative DNA helicase
MPTPQQDLDAERELLASLMLDQDNWLLVEDIIFPAVWSDPVYQHCADAAIGLLKSKKPADAVSVEGWLKDHGKLDESVPGGYVHELTPYGTTVNTVIRSHAERLRNLWALRERRKVALDILNDPSPGSAEEKIAKDSSRLLAIETGKLREARKAGDIIIDRVLELNDEFKKGEADRWSRQVPTGLRDLDAVINGMEPGELVAVCARPSVGKSAFLLAISEHLGASGIPVGIFWLEDFAKQWATRAIAKRALVPGKLLRHGSQLRKEHWNSINLAAQSSFDWPIWLDDTHGLTARQISQRMRRMHREHGCRVFIADHLGEFRLDREERWGERHDLAMGMAMQVFRDTAAELGAVPILMAQLGREIEKRTGGEPKLSDIFGTGIAEQVVRVALFLGRDKKKPDRVFATVMKNTNGPKDVTIEFLWEPDTMTVRTLPPMMPSAPPVRYAPYEADDD